MRPRATQETGGRARARHRQRPLYLAHCGPDTRFLFVNRPYAARFERAPADVVGKTIAEVVGGPAYESLRPHVEAATSGRAVEFEVEVPYATGPRQMRYAYVPERASCGEKVGLVAVIQDVTAQRSAEAAARRESDRAAAILASINEGFVVLDADWRFAYVNPAFERMNAVRREDVIGKDHWEVYPATVGTRIEAEYRRVVAEGVTTEFENHYEPWDRWFAVKAYPATGGGVCVHVREVAAEKRARAELEASERRLRFLDALGQATRPAADAESIMATTALLLGEYLGVTRCAYADVDPDNDRFTIRSDWTDGAPTSSGVYSLDLFGPRAASDMRGGQTLVIRDVRGELAEAGGADAFLAIGINAVVCCPLVVDGRLRAMMAVHSAAPRDWTAAEVALVAAVVERSWAHVERVRAEAERERFALLAENAHDFVGVSGPSGMPAYVNPAGLNLVGLDGLDQARRTPVLDFFFPEDRPLIRDEFLPREGAAEVEVRFRHFKTGEAVWMTYGVVALKDPAGRLTGFATVSRDITARKGYEASLKDADRRKDEFLATLAHELRNPLAPIRNAVEILSRKGTTDPDARRVRDMVERQVNHMVRLVDDLLDVSRISRGKIEIRRARVGLSEIVPNAVEASGPAVEGGRHVLTVAALTEPLVVEGDAVRLTQVVVNLLTNAAKFTPEGGRIAVAVERDGGDGVIRVRDTGLGIPLEMIEQVFEMFSQVSRHLGRSQGGLGVGLTLVKRLVEMHGGAVHASSEGDGRGSEFVVRLPLARPAVERTAPRAEGRGPARISRRVLVVDDNADAADSLTELLSLGGHEARTAHDGLSAVDQFRALRPDVVLLDLGMPGGDGYETARLMREVDAGRGTVLVALTGWGQEEDRRRTADAGFDLHLVKPVGPAALDSLLAGLRPGA